MGEHGGASVLALYGLSTLFMAGAALVLALALRSGVVRDDEEPKFRMLKDDEETLP